MAGACCRAAVAKEWRRLPKVAMAAQYQGTLQKIGQGRSGAAAPGAFIRCSDRPGVDIRARTPR